MFQTIIWATDGSELADGALAVAERLARADRSKIIAVHATQLFSGGRFNGGTLAADDNDVQQKIRDQVADLRSRAVEIQLNVRTSSHADAAHMIVEAADEYAADLIVVGTHGPGALPSALLGGVAKQLLHLAPCPILVVPPPRHVPPDGVTTYPSELRTTVHAGSQDVSSL